MPQVTHVEWPAEDADRLQSFLEGVFGWEFGSPMEGMDYRMARTGENEGAAVFPAVASMPSARLASLRPPSMQTSGCSTPTDGALA